MKRCSCCAKSCAPTPQNVVKNGGVVFDECYLVMFNCECASTQAVTLWEAEEFALDVAAAAAE